MKFLHWNINGVHNKFLQDDVQKLFKKFDVVVLSETHFNVRIKCPPGFTYIARSKKIDSKTPRGGVAVFKNNSCDLEIEVLCQSLRDCVVCEIKNTDLIFVAAYIPPNNSVYFDNIYFENLKMISERFLQPPKQLILMGDLNSRTGSIDSHNRNFSHAQNPDKTINTNGRKLLKYLEDYDKMVLLNGLRWGDKRFDTKYTFFKGNLASQNDVVIANSIEQIDSFKIMDKLVFSDHCPVAVSCMVIPSTPLETIYECSKSIFNYDHCDVNKRIKPPLNMSRVDIAAAVTLMEEKAKEIKEYMNEEGMQNNMLSIKITNGIYEACRKSYTKRMPEIPLTGNLANCSSANFKAIAHANYVAYCRTTDEEIKKEYLLKWNQFEKLAKDASNEELNCSINKSWKNLKGDGKKMWDRIDWNGKSEIKPEKQADAAEISKYFKSIFQSFKTANHPKIESAKENIENHDIYIPILDDPPTMDELESAILKIGTGVSLDGLPTDIAKILPTEMKEVILQLVINVFFNDYPSEWSKQILHSLKKEGHTSADPKLRGIAIGTLLCRLYDIIIDERFRAWFHPNPEQASCKGQGCLFQLFLLMMLIDYSKEKKKELFVGFMDYEKAFDFANRAEIINDLIRRGCGKAFTNAISNMMSTSSYYPKMSNNMIGESIESDFGVTQGRRSSGDIFTFYVSEMSSAFDTLQMNDFMDPLNLAQLADDTAIFADNILSLKSKFQLLLQYSAKKYQIPNIKKTQYCHFSQHPVTDAIHIDENTTINSVHLLKGYKYLGLNCYPTNNINEIIVKNINKRMVHTSKFYAWLEANENTPIEIKLLVFDSCVMKALLYGVEAWGDITCIEKKLRKVEMKALKAILKVKKGTTNDLIYHELRRPDIISKIKDLQFQFFNKLMNTSEDEATVRSAVELCKGSKFVLYYLDLNDKNAARNVQDREERIRNSNDSMCKYYNERFSASCSIYSCMMNDHYRYIISRWRLSNHTLQIEVGRYVKPKIERENRVCQQCMVLEDEFHAIFVCPLYESARTKFRDILCHQDVSEFLNPPREHIQRTASFLHVLEKLRDDLFGGGQ